MSSASTTVSHHPTLINSSKLHLDWWHDLTNIKKTRCKQCWLRKFDCFCSTLQQLQDRYVPQLQDATVPKVCMYYHFSEIGRSANTGHVLEAICKPICESLIFSDELAESKLVSELQHQEAHGSDPEEVMTCLLYPASNAKLLSEWIGEVESKLPAQGVKQPGRYRVILLDGTYSHASRQARHLQRLCDASGVILPVVKLDLSGGYCKSAIAGVMYQPGKEKICTYQATVMALQQLGMKAALCNDLLKHLNEWIRCVNAVTLSQKHSIIMDFEDSVSLYKCDNARYILDSKVKLGKTKIRSSQDALIDQTPMSHLSDYFEVR